VDSKYFKDVIWLIWSVIHKQRKMKFIITGGDMNGQIEYLWKMYCNKFTPGARPRKLSLIIWSILYITENVDMMIPLVDRPQILFQSLLGIDKIAASLKSQEVHNIVNNELTNVIVENNYMLPQNYQRLEADQLRVIKEKERIKMEQDAKQKKINVGSMQKLNDIYKLDRMMYA
jgi:hypothetical protein